MHGFIVTALKKLHDECGRKQVALKAAAKSLLGALATRRSLTTNCTHIATLRDNEKGKK
jgi:hypothetical protein